LRLDLIGVRQTPLTAESVIRKRYIQKGGHRVTQALRPWSISCAFVIVQKKFINIRVRQSAGEFLAICFISTL